MANLFAEANNHFNKALDRHGAGEHFIESQPRCTHRIYSDDDDDLLITDCEHTISVSNHVINADCPFCHRPIR